MTSRGERDEQKAPYGTWAASASVSSSSHPASAIRDRGDGPRIGYDMDSFNPDKGRERETERDARYSSSHYSNPYPHRQPSPYSDRREEVANRGPYQSDYRLG